MSLEEYLGRYQISVMEIFRKIVTAFSPLIIFAKNSIRDIWKNPEYAYGAHLWMFICFLQNNHSVEN